MQRTQNMSRLTRWSVILAGISVVLAAFGTVPSATAQVWRVPAALAATGAAARNAGCVQGNSLTSVAEVLPDGTRRAATPAEAAAARDTRARAYYYDAGGLQVSEIVPPAGWKPVTATSQELKAYGFPPRPTQAAALRHWTSTMSRWKAPGTLGMCSTNVSYGAQRGTSAGLSATSPATGLRPDGVTNTVSNPAWAGGMAVDGSASQNIFTKSDGMWIQPQFNHGYCGAQEVYGMWSGLNAT